MIIMSESSVLFNTIHSINVTIIILIYSFVHYYVPCRQRLLWHETRINSIIILIITATNRFIVNGISTIKMYK